jgi:hypothetical protein
MSAEQRSEGTIRRWLPRLRLVGLVSMALAATAFFLWFVHPLYPIQHWLFWRYASYWLLAGLFTLSCVSAGFGTLRLVLKSPLPFAEHFTLAFGVGLYEFFLAMFAAGLFGWYGGVWFALLPTLLVGAGAWPLFRYLRRTRRRWLAARRTARPPSPFSYPILAFGLLGLAMIYFLILTPDNISYDSRWQHLGLAEQYAVSGGISRSPEGLYVATSPHLAATIYAWAMQMPLSMVFDRVELAAHMEFVGFLFTLVGVTAIARRLIGLPRPRHAWVVRLLFPAVLLYDASLSAGADHIAAIFAAPIFLAMLRAWHDPTPRWLFLLVMMLSGAAMTKYTGALLLIGFPILVMLLRFAIDGVKAALRRPERAPRVILAAIGTALGVGLLLTAPHWLKNWIWYSDPFYPLLHARLPARPWTEDSAVRFAGYLKTNLWRPELGWEGFVESVKVLFTFAFVPHDWPQFHGKLPVFGALFTIGLGLLPFLRRTRRIWLLYAAVHFGIFVWYWIHHQDRYLQAAMPLIAGGTAAVLTLAWRQHWSSKAALSGLVGISIVWGGDVWFIPTHAIVGSPQKHVLDLMAQGFKKNYKDRLLPFRSTQNLARVLPREATLLLHEERTRLGLRVRSVQDNPLAQGGISYGRYESPRALWDALNAMRVSHLAWSTQRSWEFDSLAGDLVFFDFAQNVAIGHEKVDGWTLARLPVQPPDAQPDRNVLVLGCASAVYRSGVYRLDQLTLPVIIVGAPSAPEALESVPKGTEAAVAARLDFAAIDRRCHDDSAVAGEAFAMAARRGQIELWIRRREPPPF